MKEFSQLSSLQIQKIFLAGRFLEDFLPGGRFFEKSTLEAARLALAIFLAAGILENLFAR